MNPDNAHPKSFRRHVKSILIILSGIIISLVLLFILLSPTIVKNYLNKHGEELTGRKISLEKIKINYFTTTLQITGAKMYEQSDSTVFVGFDSMLVNLKPLCLLKNEVNVQQLRVVNLTSKFIQNDSIFNFSDLIDFYSSDENTLDSSASEPYAFDLNQLEIKNGTLFYTDEEVDNTIQLKNISFLIPHIYWGGAEESQADVSFKLGSGGQISASMDYQSQTGEFTGEANLEKLDPGIILPYMQQYIRVGDLRGSFSSNIRFSGNQNSLNNLLLSGNAIIDSLEMYNMSGKKILGAIRATADVHELFPMTYKTRLSSFKIDKPYVYFALEDSLSNFEKMLVEESLEGSDTTDTEEELPYDVTIDSLIVKNGLIDFSDQRFREDFNYELSEVKVEMDSISLNTNWLEIRSSMKLNKRGKLEASVGVNPNDPLNRIELEYVLSDFQLPDVNIYSKHYMGLPILFGDMFYTNKTTIYNRQLDSKNQLVIRNVELGRKSGGLYDIPIKLALFILKDINGDVVLDIPVTGDLSDPKTRVGKIVWNTFKNFMFKIVASPFRALGNLVDASPEELQEITFNYADTTLVGKQTRSLDLLLKLEQIKPEMLIEMQYLNDRKLERSDAASQIMHADYERIHNKQAENHCSDYLKFLQETSGQDSMVLQDYEMLLAPEAQVDSIVMLREQQRIEQVSQYLQAHNDSTQIRILGYNKDDVLNIGSRPRFTIKYLLKEGGETTEEPGDTN